MIRDITIGQYYRTDSFIHKLDPRTKIIGAFVLIIDLFIFKNPIAYVLAAIYLLSIITIGVPFIISTSMMLFTKKKQGFADYMLDLREIDTSTNKIYYSLEEINLSNIKPNHEPVDFKPEREL